MHMTVVQIRADLSSRGFIVGSRYVVAETKDAFDAVNDSCAAEGSIFSFSSRRI